MCKICVGICKDIETIFGHVVDPAKLTRLIESSPLKAPDKCPYCQGELKACSKDVDWDFDCKRCRRAWIVLDGVYWLAGFDAGGHICKIQKGKVEEIHRDSALWHELWDRYAKRQA